MASCGCGAKGRNAKSFSAILPWPHARFPLGTAAWGFGIFESCKTVVKAGGGGAGGGLAWLFDWAVFNPGCAEAAWATGAAWAACAGPTATVPRSCSV